MSWALARAFPRLLYLKSCLHLTPRSNPQVAIASQQYHHLRPPRQIISTMPTSALTVKVFVAGGCYAGLSTTLNLLDLGKGMPPRLAHEPYIHHPDLPSIDFQITIADERDGFFHLIGSPLALAETEYSKKAWVKFGDIPAIQSPNIKVIQGSVSHVDCEAKTASVIDSTTKEVSTHSYDYFVSATGLRRVWPVVPQSLTRKQYLLEAEEQIHAVNNAQHGVVVVGGGAVGIEMASEIKLIKPDVKVTLVHSRDKLLSSEGLPDETKDRALELLKAEGVEVLMSHRVARSDKTVNDDGSVRFDIEFTNGHKMIASEVIMAISKSVPTTTYLPQAALNEEGYVKIRPNLNFPSEGVANADYHFCGGDAAQWSGIKRCGGAMHHGHYIAYNMHQHIMSKHVSHEPKMQELQEVEPMIGLAVGSKAVAYGPGVGTVSGEDVREAYFKDDLGFTIVWNYLQLGGPKEEVAAA